MNSNATRTPMQVLLENRETQIDIDFSIPAQQRLRFTEDVFEKNFDQLLEVLEPSGPNPTKVQVWVDSGLLSSLAIELEAFVERLSTINGIEVVSPLGTIPGGERCKRDPELISKIWEAFNAATWTAGAMSSRSGAEQFWTQWVTPRERHTGVFASSESPRQP